MAAARGINLSPAALAMERQKYPNFVNSIGMEFYLIPSGQFQMGSEGPDAHQSERPITPVTLQRFYCAKLLVTNVTYEKYDPTHRNRRSPWADDRHPVVHVNATEAENFCRWLSQKENRKYRLPTEAEWEYAARGSDHRKYPWGEELSAGNLTNFADARTRFAWRDPVIDDGFAESSPAGSYPKGASPFGLLDMAGNVWEWCLDNYLPYKGKEVINPKNLGSGGNRVMRGGSWRSRSNNVRTTARGFNLPIYNANDVGFRVVCECE
jgi:formylglycine-generating enzyme required for sulfatase activity